MASKRKTTDIVAYVKHISPRKEQSFRLSLQTDEGTVKKAICFDLKKLPMLKDRKQLYEMVKLNKVVVDKPTNAHFAEIVINSLSEITDPQPAEVNFARTEPVLDIVSIESIQEVMIGELKCVEGVITLGPAVKSVQTNGRWVDVLEGNYVTDQSGLIALTLWQEWINFFRDRVENGSVHFKVNIL